MLSNAQIKCTPVHAVVSGMHEKIRNFRTIALRYVHKSIVAKSTPQCISQEIQMLMPGIEPVTQHVQMRLGHHRHVWWR